MTALLDRRLVYVTGKGGVGKTAVTAALALAGHERGARVLVCEVAEQNRSAWLSEHGIESIAIDPDTALREWLGGQVGGAALKVLSRSQAFGYFVAAAPGARELITIAKIWELAQDERWTGAKDVYDLVIVDAPASGHGVAMLRTPETFGDIAPGGPIRRQAGKVRSMLRDPARTGFVVVSTLEEMPVTETLQFQDKLVEAVGRDPDVIVANGLLPDRLSGADREALTAVAERPAVAAAVTLDGRAREQRSHLRRLRRDARAPVVTLPHVFADELGGAELTPLGLRITSRV